MGVDYRPLGVSRIIKPDQRGFLLLEVAKPIDQRLILLRRANRNPQDLRNPLLLEVPHDHALLTQLGRQPRRVMLGVRQK